MSSGLKSSQQEGNSMIAYQSTLLGPTEVAEDTMSFRFEKPRSFLFKAGQYIDLTLLGSEPGGSNGLTHTFSIASSPWSEELVVMTRMRDTVFKCALSVLPIGAEVRVAGPPMMVEAARQTLNEAGVNEDDIRTEEFAGY